MAGTTNSSDARRCSNTWVRDARNNFWTRRANMLPRLAELRAHRNERDIDPEASAEDPRQVGRRHWRGACGVLVFCVEQIIEDSGPDKVRDGAEMHPMPAEELAVHCALPGPTLDHFEQSHSPPHNHAVRLGGVRYYIPIVAQR